MNITKDVKNKLIEAMLAKASKRQAAATTRAANSLNKLWRELIISEIQKVIPEVPQNRWAPLIQQNVFTALTGEVSVYVNKEVPDRWHKVKSDTLGARVIPYRSSKDREPDREKWALVQRALAANWGGFFNFLKVYKADSYRKFSWVTSYPDLPSIQGLSNIYSADLCEKPDAKIEEYSKKADPLAKHTDRIMDQFMAVMNSTAAMYDDLTAILASIRTLKQLEEQFPDAVAFLPKEVVEQVRNTKQVADPELIKRAQRQLVEGIPD